MEAVKPVDTLERFSSNTPPSLAHSPAKPGAAQSQRSPFAQLLERKNAKTSPPPAQAPHQNRTEPPRSRQENAPPDSETEESAPPQSPQQTQKDSSPKDPVEHKTPSLQEGVSQPAPLTDQLPPVSPPQNLDINLDRSTNTTPAQPAAANPSAKEQNGANSTDVPADPANATTNATNETNATNTTTKLTTPSNPPTSASADQVISQADIPDSSPPNRSAPSAKNSPPAKGTTSVPPADGTGSSDSPHQKPTVSDTQNRTNAQDSPPTSQTHLQTRLSPVGLHPETTKPPVPDSQKKSAANSESPVPVGNANPSAVSLSHIALSPVASATGGKPSPSTPPVDNRVQTAVSLATLSVDLPQSDQGHATQPSGPDPKLQDLHAPQPESSTDGLTTQPAGIDPTANQAANPTSGTTSTHQAGDAAIGGDSDPDALIDRIGTNILQVTQGGKVLRMRLHPPELGVLHIEVVSHDGAVTARLNVENAAAHQVIQDHLHQLQDMLHRTNTHVDRIELNLLDSQTDAGFSSHAGLGQFASSQQTFDDGLNDPFLNDQPDVDAVSDTLAPSDSAQQTDLSYKFQPLSGIDIHI